MSRFDADFQRTALPTLLLGHGETGTYSPHGGTAITGQHFLVRELPEQRDAGEYGREIMRRLEVELSASLVEKPGERDTYTDAKGEKWTFAEIDERSAAGTHVLIFHRQRVIERTSQDYRH